MADDLLSGQITFSGLGSGTDFNEVVDKLIEVDGVHKRQLEYWKSQWETKIEALQALNNSMVEVRTALGAIDTMDEFLTKTVAVSDTTVLTATADASAEEATHTVLVNQLAQNSIWMSSSGVSDQTAVLASSASTFTYSYTDPDSGNGLETVNITVPKDTSLEGLRNLINTDPNNPGVKASIVSDGSSSYLQIRGLDLGSEADLAISNASFFGLGSFSESQVNQNAQVRINGWPAASWIESDSNTISGAVEGLSFSLKSADPGSTIQVAVNMDSEGVKENVRTFVEKVNELRSAFLTLTDFDETEQRGSVLTGNYAVQLVDSRLKYAVADLAKGFLRSEGSFLGDTYTSLSQVGILTDADEGSVNRGLLTLDEDKLAEALADDPDAVAQLFAANNIGGQRVTSATGSFSYYSHISGITQGGTYDVSYSINASGQIDANSAYINGNKASVDTSAGTITAVNDQGEALGMVLKVNDFTPSSNVTGYVTLKQGKISEISNLLKELSDKDEGPLSIIEDNYNNITDNIDKKIEREQERLDLKEKRLKLQFARLEALLGNYNNISNSLGNQIKQLDQ